MPSYLSALLLTLLITLALAAPTTHQRKGRSFKVNRVRNVNFSGYDGPSELLRALGKYGMALPEGLASIGDSVQRHKGHGQGAAPDALSATDAGTMPTRVTNQPASATSGTSSSTTTGGGGGGGGEVGDVITTPEPQDVEFLSPVVIGGQTINMDFDTGSSDLWVFNTQLNAAGQANRTVFDPAKSSTFQLMQGASFSISYGDGSAVKGDVGTDTVNIGGAIVQNQAVELATAVSGSFLKDKHNDGLVGLAFSKLNTVKPAQQKTFFDNALPDLAEPVFTANLKAGAAGDYEFGKIDNTKFNGALSWAPINTTNGFWQFSSQQFSVNNGTPVMAPGGQAIADTGTTLLLVNPAVVNAYYSQVQGATNDQNLGGVTFPCNADLPDLQVDVGGNYMANIPGHLVNFATADAAGTSKSSLHVSIYGSP